MSFYVHPSVQRKNYSVYTGSTLSVLLSALSALSAALWLSIPATASQSGCCRGLLTPCYLQNVSVCTWFFQRAAMCSHTHTSILWIR